MTGVTVFLMLSAVSILTVKKRTKNAKPRPEEMLKVELPVVERHRLLAPAELPGLTNKYGQPAELANTGIIELSDREPIRAPLIRTKVDRETEVAWQGR